MLLIYVHKITPRIEYIFDFVFNCHFTLSYRLTIDRDEFFSYQGPKLNYSYEEFDNIPWIYPTLLLVQDDLVPQFIDVEHYRNTHVFFCRDKGSLPFDLFAASFYLLTRHEEYFESNVDRFGRYDPRNSIAWKKGFLTQPVVNLWLEWLLELLLSFYPSLEYKAPTYKFVPTIDIDNAYAYQRKGFLRQFGGLVRSLALGNIREAGERLRVHIGMEQDPYDTYDQLYEIHYRFNLTPYFFFLLANYGGHDRAISVNDKEFQSLILKHAQKFNVGLHPSFSSFFDISVLRNEVEWLSSILGKDVEYSRFHFVKFALPQSYENLLAVNIKHDFSMGYPSRLGFRCGYAGDYKFFNLKTNKATDLTIHPFQAMDAALNFYMKLDPDTAVEHVRQIIDSIKKVNGTFSMVWHNESLSNRNSWQGWRLVYEQIVRYAVE